MDLAARLMDLKREGQRSFTTREFKPNGGRNFRQSKSYNDNPALCNKHIFKLLIAGKAVVVPWSILTTEEQAQIHVNTLQLAPSSNPNREGRCCINMSYESPVMSRRASSSKEAGKLKTISINEGTDLCRSDRHYPKVDLPSARDLCELAEAQRARYEPQGEILEGATIDISDAYRQFTVSVEAIMNRTVMIVIKGVKYIVFALCGWFGDTRAGHVYNLTGSYIDFRHHQFQTQKKVINLCG